MSLRTFREGEAARVGDIHRLADQPDGFNTELLAVEATLVLFRKSTERLLPGEPAAALHDVAATAALAGDSLRKLRLALAAVPQARERCDSIHSSRKGAR